MSPYHRPSVRIGLDLEELVRVVPGSDWVLDTGFPALGDFAKTPVGFQVLSVLSGGGYTALAPIIGPGVVVLTTSVPGLVAGDDFTTAFTKGVADSVSKLIFLLPFIAAGPAGAGLVPLKATVDRYLKDITDTLNRREFQELIDGIALRAKQEGITAKTLLDRGATTIGEIAGRFGVREDVAAHAVNARTHEIVYNTAEFDIRTGRRYPPFGTLPPPLTLDDVPTNLSSAEYVNLEQRAKADGRTPPAVLDALNSFFLIARNRELAGEDPYKQWKIMETSSRSNPDDRRIAELADKLRVRYQAIATPRQRVLDSRRAVVEAEEARARSARSQPPPPAEILQRLDLGLHELRNELRQNERVAFLPATGIGFTVPPAVSLPQRDLSFAVPPAKLTFAEVAIGAAAAVGPALLLFYTPWGKALLRRGGRA